MRVFSVSPDDFNVQLRLTGKGNDSIFSYCVSSTLKSLKDTKLNRSASTLVQSGQAEPSRGERAGHLATADVSSMWLHGNGDAGAAVESRPGCCAFKASQEAGPQLSL